MTTAAKKAAAPKPSADDDGSKSAKRKGTAYKVTGSLIAVPVGEQVLQYRVGDILPDGVAAEDLERLSNDGLIAESE